MAAQGREPLLPKPAQASSWAECKGGFRALLPLTTLAQTHEPAVDVRASPESVRQEDHGRA